MSYGPTPWVQRHWDLRAATNFVAGGAGAGLVVASVASGARGAPAAVALVAGLAFVGLGLFAVWLEIGRPLRALNVFANPRTSWMSREAIAAVVLGVLAIAGAWLHAAGSANAPAIGALATIGVALLTPAPLAIFVLPLVARLAGTRPVPALLPARNAAGTQPRERRAPPTRKARPPRDERVAADPAARVTCADDEFGETSSGS